jgi:hypothetical protein
MLANSQPFVSYCVENVGISTSHHAMGFQGLLALFMAETKNVVESLDRKAEEERNFGNHRYTLFTPWSESASELY